MSQSAPDPVPTRSSAGRVVLTLIAIVAVSAAAVWVINNKMSGQSEVGVKSAERQFICSETLKPFNYDLKTGDTIPVMSPFSGKATGYPAELCFWTKDGKTKEAPTPVLLNELVGKPAPTFCPDCGRLVVSHNPPPTADGKAPPTQAEYVPPSTEPTTAPASRDRDR